MSTKTKKSPAKQTAEEAKRARWRETAKAQRLARKAAAGASPAPLREPGDDTEEGNGIALPTLPELPSLAGRRRAPSAERDAIVTAIEQQHVLAEAAYRVTIERESEHLMRITVIATHGEARNIVAALIGGAS